MAGWLIPGAWRCVDALLAAVIGWTAPLKRAVVGSSMLGTVGACARDLVERLRRSALSISNKMQDKIQKKLQLYCSTIVIVFNRIISNREVPL